MPLNDEAVGSDGLRKPNKLLLGFGTAASPPSASPISTFVFAADAVVATVTRAAAAAAAAAVFRRRCRR
eukprot:3890458-Pleurochrysis_carterae.AAC.3